MKKLKNYVETLCCSDMFYVSHLFSMVELYLVKWTFVEVVGLASNFCYVFP